MNTPRRILACIAIGVIAAVIALLSHSTHWLERLELLSWDVRQRSLAKPAPPDLPIRLILIDQPSLDWAREQSGTPWPWPREFYRAIIDFCRAAGAKSIVFDLFFSEPSMFGQDDDDRFAAALKSGGATVLAVPPGPRLSTPGTWQADIPPSPFTVDGWTQWQARHPRADLALNSVVMSLPEIAGSVSALGHVRGDQDMDSIIRRATPIVTFDGQTLPVLGLAAHQVGDGVDEGTANELRIDGDSLMVGPHRIPLDDDGMAILQYRRPIMRGGQLRMYDAYSAAGVINSQLAIESGQPPALSPGVFKDCNVIIGPSAVGTYDLKPTPMNKAGPGAEVHATFLDNLISDGFMHRSNDTLVWLFTIGLTLIGAFAALESRNGLHVMLAFLLTLPLPWLVGVIAFKQGAWWPIVVPELGLCMALVGGLTANYATEGRQRRFIKRTFQHFLSPVVIEQIVRDPARLRLGGERRELTIFFSDIAGFSSIAEKLDAESLTVLLNDYLADMTNIILEEEGTLDKYIGDAIVAFWNAPLDQPDHAQRAVRAAARCQRALAERRAAYRERFGVDLHARIGLNTGIVSVGNFGSEGRFDYTIIGHAANLASRLEGSNKYFGTSTLVAEETWEKAGDAARGCEVGLIRVVGVHEPVRVYALLAHDAPVDQRSFDAYQNALAMCQEGKSAAALTAFERLADDPLSQLYLKKLRSHALDGQRAWDGVWNLTEK